MKQKVQYTEKQPRVRCFPISESRADVIVNNFIGKVVNEENEESEQSEIFEYESNSFSVNPKELSQQEIEAFPEYYLTYQQEEDTLEKKVKRLQEENEFLTQCIMEMSEVIYNV